MYSLIKSKIVLYRRQAGRIICLLVMLIIGSATITSVGYLIRSQKCHELNKSLTETGNYDGIIYNVPSGMTDSLISGSELIADYGSYIEVGTVTASDSDVAFKGAIFKDIASEEMYHMPCIRGSYPSEENEVAIDISTAQILGISPYPGSEIQFEIYDELGRVNNVSTYIVSGVFEASSDDVWCGWYRYPYDIYNEGEYLMPSIFFFDGLYSEYQPGNEVVFIQARDSADSSEFIGCLTDITAQLGDNARFQYNDRRANAYAYSMGILDSLESQYGDSSYSTVSQAIKDGYGIKDFFSSVLIPAVCVMIMIIEVLSINALTHIIISDRKDYYATIRLLGMSTINLIIDILIEFSFLGFVGITCGVLSGVVMHNVMIRVVSIISHVTLESGLAVPDAIRIVTYDPVKLSFVVCIFSLWLALIVPMRIMKRLTPVEFLNSESDYFTSWKRTSPIKKTRYNDGWLATFSRRINMHDSITLIALTMILSVMLFGYCYFRAYSDCSTVDYQFYLDENNMDDFDYVSRRSTQISDASYMVSNKHSSGITHDSVLSIAESGMVDELYAVIRNLSTRVSFSEMPSEELLTLLGNHNLKMEFDNSALGVAGERGQSASLEAMGYSPSDYIYELPTVGIRETELLNLNDYVVTGNIDIQAIRSGNEVIVAVPYYLLDSVMRYYSVGTEIYFSDVMLDDNTEEMNFNSEEAFDDRYHVYDETVTDENGNEISVFASAYGKRYDISCTVGAIVALDDKMCDIYLEPDNDGVNYVFDEETGEEIKQVSYGMSLIVDEYTFANWGLPDKNYTNVYATLSDNTDINEFDRMWYLSLSASKDVETISAYYYLSKINANTMEIMAVFYLLAVCLIVLGSVSVSVGLYSKIRNNREKLLILRKIGLSAKQGAIMIIVQNIYYPLIAAIASVIPLFVCQSLFIYIKDKLESGEWESSYISGVEPWYADLPYNYNLFDYEFERALLICVFTGVLLVLVGSIPQIIYLRKNKMIQVEE